jgi:hypothetical protein
MNIDFENFHYGAFVAFLKKDSSENFNLELDWDYMNKLNFEKFTVYDKLKDLNFIEKAIENKNLVNFNSNKKRLVIIKEVNYHLNEATPFPKQENGSMLTYADYFREKYSIEAEKKNQPLVEINQTEMNSNFLLKTPEFKKARSQKKRKYQEFFLAEHLNILPFTQNQMCTLFMLPVVFYRLNCLLKALKLKNIIEKQIINDLNIVNVI